MARELRRLGLITRDEPVTASNDPMITALDAFNVEMIATLDAFLALI